MARLAPTPTVVKRLFALSGNKCAFPGCETSMVNSTGTVIGQICHIEAAEIGGERYNNKQTDEERRSFENLILLCANDHTKTNDVSKYTVEVLKKMKAEHEKKFINKEYSASDKIVEQAIKIYMEQANHNDSGNQINNQVNTQNISNQIVNQTNHYYPEIKKKIKFDGIRKINEEAKLLINDFKNKANEASKTVIDFRDDLKEKQEKPVYIIPIRYLKFRKDNGRIIAAVESFEKENNIVLDENEEKTQVLLKKFLLENDKEKNEELKKLLTQKGQRDPAIITCDGFLVNGNRRKLALEELGYETMKVVILPEDATELDIQKIENRYQLQSEGKAEYHGLNRALTIKRNIARGFKLEDQLRDDPNYHSLPQKEFNKKKKEFEKKYLKPLECVDRYLETFNREGLYNTISDNAGSDGVGDREGRWQAFIDYSNFYYGILTNQSKQTEYEIKDIEVSKIEDAVFKIIRKRKLSSKETENPIGKVHDFVRKLPKYLKNPESKKFILKIADEVKEDIPDELKYNRDGNKEEDERELDNKWGAHFQKQILGNLMQAYKILYNQQERDKPLELLEDALKKLKHNNLKIENIHSEFHKTALQLADQIILQAESIHKAIDDARFKHKKSPKKVN